MFSGMWHILMSEDGGVSLALWDNAYSLCRGQGAIVLPTDSVQDHPCLWLGQEREGTRLLRCTPFVWSPCLYQTSFLEL